MGFRKYLRTVALSALILMGTGVAIADEGDDWITRSNENSMVLLEVLARFSPEGAGQLGVDGLDEEIFQGIRSLLDDRVPEERRGAALVGRRQGLI